MRSPPRSPTPLGGTADVVIDPVFGWVVEAAMRAMTPRGRLVNIGGLRR